MTWPSEGRWRSLPPECGILPARGCCGAIGGILLRPDRPIFITGPLGTPRIARRQPLTDPLRPKRGLRLRPAARQHHAGAARKYARVRRVVARGRRRALSLDGRACRRQANAHARLVDWRRQRGHALRRGDADRHLVRSGRRLRGVHRPRLSQVHQGFGRRQMLCTPCARHANRPLLAQPHGVPDRLRLLVSSAPCCARSPPPPSAPATPRRSCTSSGCAD